MVACSRGSGDPPDRHSSPCEPCCPCPAISGYSNGAAGGSGTAGPSDPAPRPVRAGLLSAAAGVVDDADRSGRRCESAHAVSLICRRGLPRAQTPHWGDELFGSVYLRASSGFCQLVEAETLIERTDSL